MKSSEPRQGGNPPVPDVSACMESYRSRQVVSRLALERHWEGLSSAPGAARNGPPVAD